MRDLFTEVSLLWSSPSKAGGSKSDLNTLVYWQEGEEDVVEPTGSRVAEDWDRPHRGLKVLPFVAPSNNLHLLCLKDDSRWKQLIKTGSMCLLSFHYLTMDIYYVSYNSLSFSILLFNWSQ